MCINVQIDVLFNYHFYFIFANNKITCVKRLKTKMAHICIIYAIKMNLTDSINIYHRFWVFYHIEGDLGTKKFSETQDTRKELNIYINSYVYEFQLSWNGRLSLEKECLSVKSIEIKSNIILAIQVDRQIINLAEQIYKKGRSFVCFGLFCFF